MMKISHTVVNRQVLLIVSNFVKKITSIFENFSI